MKIFFITGKLKNPDTACGSVIEFDYKMRELQRLGNEVTAVTVFSYNNDLKKSPPYRLIEEFIRPPTLFSIHWNIFKILRKYEKEADIFYIEGQFMYGAGLYRRLGGLRPIFAYLMREPLIKDDAYVSFVFQKYSSKKRNYSLRAFWRFCKKKIRRFIERFILMWLNRKIDYVACLNPMQAKEFYNTGLKAAIHPLIIGDPYPMDEVMKKAGINEFSYRNRAGKNDKVTIFYSGRMTAGKGYDLLLTGFSQVKNKERFHLILGGSGPEEPKVRQMINDFKLEPYIEMPGWVSRDELYEFLKQADIYVFTRWGRNLSAVAMTEAVVFGLPSIVPAGTGLAWLAGKSALTFKEEDPEDLARQIERLEADLELRKELSRQCYERLKEPDLDPHQTIVAMNVIMKSLVFGPRDKYPLDEFVNGFHKK